MPAPTEQDIADDILKRVEQRGAGKSCCPSETARALAGTDPDQWGPLMGPVRAVAVRLAMEGRITILRKGKPVDPARFKGVYRLAIPTPGETRSDEPEGG